MKSKTNNFVGAEPGSLWYRDSSPRQHILHDGVVLTQKLALLPRQNLLSNAIWVLLEGGDPSYFFDYVYGFADGFADRLSSIIKLDEIRQIATEKISNNLPRATVINTANFYKILATTASGKLKVGWVAEQFIENLKPYEKHKAENR